MRFLRLHARVFGPLRDVALDLDADAVLVFGRNEAGKSTLRSALETAIYGFDPATRDGHPLYLWNAGAAGDLHLEADLRVGGRVLRVERVLQATGKLRTAEEGAAFEGPREGNRTLPVVGGLSRELYRSIYALELDQLEALQRNVQSHVDDLLLPETEALGLLPVSRLKEELRADHRRLWRSDRSRSPRAAKLQEALHEAREELGRARTRELELREARAERASLEEELERSHERKRALEEERRNAPFLLALFELNQRATEQEARPIDLSPLGDLPLVSPGPLRADIDELEDQLLEPRARLECEEERMSETAETILSARVMLEAALAGASEHAAEHTLRDEKRAQARGHREAALRELGACLSATPKPDDLEAASRVPLEGLRAAQSGWLAAWEEPATETGWAGGLRLWALAPALLAALVVGAVALGALDPPWAGLGALFVLATAVLAALPRRRRAQAPVPANLGELLQGLAVAKALLARPTDLQRLVETLVRVQRLLGEAREAEDAVERLEAGRRERERTWVDLCEEFGLDTAGGGDALVARLQSAIEAARERARRVEHDAEEREHARRELAKHGPTLERKRDHLSRLEKTLARSEPEAASPMDAYERLEQRITEARMLREREAELKRDPRWEIFADDPRATAACAPADAPWLPEVAARRDAEIDACERRTREIAERQGKLRHMLGDDAGSHEARAREEAEALDEELRRVERERDRLALLESILERAEKTFRDEHQPDVMRRASAYLDRVTLGRYRRLDFLEGSEDGLHVTSRDWDEPIPAGPPISRGTLDQIFLCLRLGLLDHLDEGREKPPLVLDDALLRMDDARRPRVYRLLAEVAQQRQIFVLTCHRSLADEVQRALTARRVEIPA